MNVFNFIFIAFIYNGLVNCQTNMINYYKLAMPLIQNSNEFKEYGFNQNNYHVSSEIISFSNYSQLFTNKLDNGKLFEINKNEVSGLNNDLLKLNKKECGKIKMYFSEIKEGFFFVEVFVSKKKNLKYKNRPVFGLSKVYLFKVLDEKISISKIKLFHYN